MLLLCFYLHAVWRGRGTTRVLRHILQFLLLLVACYIALSRVRDYWHHWSDVLAGALLGIVYAVLTAVYVGRMLRQGFADAASSHKHKKHQYKLGGKQQVNQLAHTQHHHPHQLTSSQHRLAQHDARSGRMLLVAASGSVSNLQQQQLLPTAHEDLEKQQLHEQVVKEHLVERGSIGGGGGGDCEWKLQAVVLPT